MPLFSTSRILRAEEVDVIVVVPGMFPPTEENIRDLEPGDFIKVSVDDEFVGMRETFWVIVRRNVDGIVSGNVNQDLVFTGIHGLSNESWLEVPHDSIIAILPQQ